MAHFAQLDENNVVTQVIVVANEELLLDGVENETKGIMFCKSLLGDDTRWVQTSYNATIRKNYAGIGYTYDANLDAFIAPKPFESWVLDEDTATWEAPVARPEGNYAWDEPTVSWKLVPEAETPAE
jgi:hypothetical protein